MRAGKTPARFAFLAIIAMWMVLPFAMYGSFGQDGIPYVVAGELATADPHAVYATNGGDIFTLDPDFARRYCELAPVGTNCDDTNVAFVSTPFALPIAWVLAHLGGDGAVLVLRVVAAACLAGGMWAIADHLRRRRGDVDGLLALVALLLTPFAMVPVGLAQTSPILFASAALGVSRTERSNRWAALVALLWVLAVVLKAWPVVLVLILLWQRRWRMLAWSAGWFALLVLAMLPFTQLSLFGDFLRTSSGLNATAAGDPNNGSLGALAHAISQGLATGGGATALLAVRLILVGLAWWWARRAVSDSQWAFGYLTLLLLSPFVWWHYVWVAVAAIGVVLVGRPHLGREVMFLPVLAALTIPISIAVANGRPWPVPQALFLLLAVGVVSWLMAASLAGRRDERRLDLT